LKKYEFILKGYKGFFQRLEGWKKGAPIKGKVKERLRKVSIEINTLQPYFSTKPPLKGGKNKAFSSANQQK